MVQFPPLPSYAHGFKEDPSEEDFVDYKKSIKRYKKLNEHKPG